MGYFEELSRENESLDSMAQNMMAQWLEHHSRLPFGKILNLCRYGVILIEQEGENQWLDTHDAYRISTALEFGTITSPAGVELALDFAAGICLSCYEKRSYGEPHLEASYDELYESARQSWATDFDRNLARFECAYRKSSEVLNNWHNERSYIDNPAHEFSAGVEIDRMLENASR